jgi:type I restriction enzyme S subunit
MSRYETYKPSGIDWIGDVPKHWEIIRVKGNCYVKGRIGWQELRAEEFIDDGIHCVTGTDFNNQFVNWDTCYRVNLERYLIDDNIQLKEGDVLITKDGTIGKTAIVKNLPEKATLNSGIFLVRPEKARLENEYLYWILNSKVFEDYNDYTKTGATILHLYQNVFVEMHFPLPDNDEQLAIANYLDDQTQKIDRLIANKKAQAEKLKELRQIEINNSVTKGLNPNAEMKDSGIEWLGEIPKHWEVKRLKKYTTKIGSGVTPKGGSEVYEDYGIPIFRSQNIHFDCLRLDDVAFINEEIHNSMSGSKVQSYDVLLNITGASIGRCFYYDGSLGEANVNQHVCVIRTNTKLHYLFLHLFLSSDSGQSQIFMGQVGTSREGLTFQDIKNITFALPPIKEQIQIAKYLQNRTTAIDQLIKNIEAQIEKLQELRKIKIYEAVTGKIKVSGYE